MIILDLSRVFYATIAVATRNEKKTPEIDFLRHLILNSIRAGRKRFALEYGEFVIATDCRENYWRRDLFPYYKANRKKGREEDDLDWPAIFEMVNQIKAEIETYLPYKMIKVDGAEADDIIAVLTKKYHSQGVLILANDHDFVQLHKLPNVKQWNPVRSKWIREKDPVRYLQEHIIKGDSGDGIPSLKENDNALILPPTFRADGKKVRRASITQVAINKWLAGDPKLTMTAEEYRNYVRNRELIDFDYIPEHISDAILENYETHPDKDRKRIFNYFMEKRLRNLMGSISDF